MIAALIQARMGSERLPGKSLMPLGKSTVLGCVIERVKLCKKIDKIIVVTQDIAIAREAMRHEVDWSMTDTEGRDVLKEYYEAAKKNDVDVIVRITGDCPCVCPKEIDRAVKSHLRMSNDYTYNRCDNDVGDFVDGMDVEVFGYDELDISTDHPRAETKEHVTPHMRERAERVFREAYPLVELDSRLMLSINTRVDYMRIKLLYGLLPDNFTTEDIKRITEGDKWRFIPTVQVQGGRKP
jgi:spore coat polysaccharide biosynthesis protein SpsF